MSELGPSRGPGPGSLQRAGVFGDRSGSSGVPAARAQIRWCTCRCRSARLCGSRQGAAASACSPPFSFLWGNSTRPSGETLPSLLLLAEASTDARRRLPLKWQMELQREAAQRLLEALMLHRGINPPYGRAADCSPARPLAHSLVIAHMHRNLKVCVCV